MTSHDIQGWCDFHDLYDEAVLRASDGAVLVEVGCWLGKSSAYLWEKAHESGKDITLIYVDTWKGEEGQTAHEDVVREHGGTLLPQWRENMIGCGASFTAKKPRIKVMEMTSLKAAAKIKPASVDFVFIDAAHDYASVSVDLDAWLPKLKPTGHIAGHDYGYHCVASAVDERLTVRARNSSWERIPLPQS